MRNYNYVDSCLTYEILLQDSGLSPKPTENWNTFVPTKGDIAHVDADDSVYGWNGNKWIKLENEDPTKEYVFDGDEWTEIKSEEQPHEN